MEEGLDIEIDKLTNSVENAISGDRFETVVSLVRRSDLPSITKKQGWVFNWAPEFREPICELYKLTIVGNPTVIQGLVSIENTIDHIHLRLIESAPFNKSKSKIYVGVPGNLVAYVCRLAFQRGHEGNVAFLSKSLLIKHYEENLGARHVGGRIMVLDTPAALKLIDRYYK